MGKKDLQQRISFATTVLLQNENEPNAKFSNIEQKFKTDLSIQDFFTCEDETKQEFVARIKELYLTSFSKEFDIQLVSYDATQNSYREQNPYNYKEIDTLYSTQNNQNISKHFNLITDKKLKGSYIGKFNITDSFQKIGTLFVLLKPLLIASEGTISDILVKNTISDIFNTYEYSFAIYSKGKLSRHVGSFSYALNNKSKNNNYDENGYNHVVYTDDLNNSIIVSKKHKTWVQILSGFTLIILCTIVLFITYYLLLLIKHYYDNWRNSKTSKMRFLSFIYNRYRIPFWDRLFLGHKLQVYIIGTVFTTFCFIIIVTTQFISNSSKQQQKELLQSKTTRIVNSISSQADIKAVFTGDKNNLLYDLSKFFNTDINLYDTSGKLIFTSNDKIYHKDLIGKLMRPEVFMRLNGEKRISTVTDEKLGSLNYISSYQGLFDNNLNLIGYLNLPYFGNEQELLQEISSYGATLINIFALVFAIAAIFSYYFGQRITKPLNAIRNKLGNTKLGNTEIQPIQYNSNDEIGQLVLEYNKMLTKLEDSKNKLAESEREGAWKEMAKQVAHEIKNPLTPMKLSLQHLQYSLTKENPENIIPKVNKVSELLINQIDNLSRMAEEFSSFAKMPEAKLEKVNINKILENCVELFNKEENVIINIHLKNSNSLVFVDEQQFSRVITNLLKNALQSIPENKTGNITVGLKLFKNTVQIWVTDNGKGIPKDLFPKIFSPNFSTKNSGMGLGLAMSKKIIEQFNGKIFFVSEIDLGTTFYIEIPKC